MLKIWEKYLLSIRKAGSSCGAIIEVRANGVPAGLGAPIYSKLDSDIASAMMSINAVKGVNIGSGMNSAQLSGEENSDEIFKNKNGHTENATTETQSDSRCNECKIPPERKSLQKSQSTMKKLTRISKKSRVLLDMHGAKCCRDTSLSRTPPIFC